MGEITHSSHQSWSATNPAACAPNGASGGVTAERPKAIQPLGFVASAICQSLLNLRRSFWHGVCVSLEHALRRNLVMHLGGRVKNLCIAIAILGLAGCASSPSSTTTSGPEAWSAYRNQVEQERDGGTLTPLQAEAKLEARYSEIYGPDPMMEAAFAYGKRLYTMAAAGRLPIEEADALADARIDEILARREAQTRFHAWMASRFPPEPSD